MATDLSNLTRREREVLTLMADGDSNATIGEILSIKHQAVEKHTRAIYDKLGLPHTDGTKNRRVCAVLLFLQSTR